MTFIVENRQAPALSTIQESAPLLPAVIAKNPVSVFQRHDTFNALMDTRGENVVPTSRLARFFNHPCSWGVFVSAAATTVTGALTIAGLVPAFAPLVAGGIAAAFGAIGGTYPTASTPLEVIASRRPLRQRDLAFLAGSAEAGPLQQAVDGKLAESWIQRIDRQRVHGEAACADLEDVIALAKTLPRNIQERAAKLVAVHNATLEDDGTYPTSLSDYTVRDIIRAIEQLDDADRPECAAQLMKRYFKGDLPLVRFDEHHCSRDLYRALRAAMRPKPAVVPALQIPDVNAARAAD